MTSNFSELTRSPVWRKDYKQLIKYRKKMYLTFLIYKIVSYPSKVLSEISRIISRDFQTKMEMSIYKYIKLRTLYYIPKLYYKGQEIKFQS